MKHRMVKVFVTAILPILLPVLMFSACDSGPEPRPQLPTKNKPYYGRVKQWTQLNSNQKPIIRYDISYDDSGRVARKIIWDSTSGGINVMEQKYIYEDTLVKEVISLNHPMYADYRDVYIYDEKDQLIKIENRGDSVLLGYTQNIYNDKGY